MPDVSNAGSAGESSASWWGDEPDAGGGTGGTGSSGGAGDTGGTRRTWVIAVIAVVLVAAAAGGAMAVASKHSSKSSASATGGNQGGQFGRRPGTQGTIDAISRAGLTLTTASKTTVKVAVASSTSITDTTKRSLADLQTGDHIRVIGSADDSGAVTAQVVIDGKADSLSDGFGGAGRPNGNRPPGGSGQFPEGAPPSNGQEFPGAAGRGGMTAGTITSINGATVTVKDSAGTSVNVTTTSTTTVQVTKKLALKDLAKGDTVTVTGSTTKGTIKAIAIRRGADTFAGGGLGRPGYGGPGGPGGSLPAAP